MQARIEGGRGRLAIAVVLTTAVLSEVRLVISEVGVFVQQLAAVLLVSQSHASILVCQSVEKISDGLIIGHILR